MLAGIVQFLVEQAVPLGSVASIVAIVEYLFSPIRTLRAWLRPPPPQSVTITNPDSFAQPAAPQLETGTMVIRIADFKATLAQERDEARADLAAAADGEREDLQQRLDELTRRFADPEAAFAQYQSTITDLEAKLTRRGNEIGGDRANEAKAALERGDFTLAKSLFEEIAARAQPEVIASSDASYALGQIAETEIRWHDAAAHYAQAARLNPGFDALRKASRFAERSGDYATAATHSAALLALATSQGDAVRLSQALNEHAINLRALGQFEAAEALYRQALEIDAKTTGTAHPAYATHLNNLAGVVQARGRYPEAEMLFLKALEIGAKTIGTTHPDYGTNLNNLALVIKAQGRLPEAETLYRQAAEISANSIGTAHPAYATRLNNLAGVVQAQGRFPEAEMLLRKALEIDAKSVGTAHPDYATDLSNLAGVVQARGRDSEAETLYRQAITILRGRLGDAHPTTRQVAQNLLTLLETHNPTASDLPALRALLDAPQP